MHSWKATGFDPDINEPNVWQCRKCRMVKAMAAFPSRISSRGNELFDIEYSELDGTILGENLIPVPTCGGV